MSVLYVIEQHDQLLHLWQNQHLTDLNVVHLDFHCDMRGLLINRQTQQAYQISDGRQPVDEGNFLMHAIMEKRVHSVRWVHRIPGGRQFDVGTVKYETDLTGYLLHWLLVIRGQTGIPIQYDVMHFKDWRGLEQGDFLDIDWDFFACVDYPIETIEQQVETFFSVISGYAPKQVSVCYSPNYSHPSRAQFEAFVHRLARVFRSEIIRLPHPTRPQEEQSRRERFVPKSIYGFARNQYYRTNLWLRKQGIY